MHHGSFCTFMCLYIFFGAQQNIVRYMFGLFKLLYLFNIMFYLFLYLFLRMYYVGYFCYLFIFVLCTACVLFVGSKVCPTNS